MSTQGNKGTLMMGQNQYCKNTKDSMKFYNKISANSIYIMQFNIYFLYYLYCVFILTRCLRKSSSFTSRTFKSIVDACSLWSLNGVHDDRKLKQGGQIGICNLWTSLHTWIIKMSWSQCIILNSFYYTLLSYTYGNEIINV